MAMALDEPRENDSEFTIDNFKYLVDKDLLEKAKPIKIDFLVNGFKIDCSINFQSACASSGCGSSCAC